jgi:hypothetical protein
MSYTITCPDARMFAWYGKQARIKSDQVTLSFSVEPINCETFHRVFVYSPHTDVEDWYKIVGKVFVHDGALDNVIDILTQVTKKFSVEHQQKTLLIVDDDTERQYHHWGNRGNIRILFARPWMMAHFEGQELFARMHQFSECTKQ